MFFDKSLVTTSRNREKDVILKKGTTIVEKISCENVQNVPQETTFNGLFKNQVLVLFREITFSIKMNEIL